jgi:hypothetical protein
VELNATSTDSSGFVRLLMQASADREPNHDDVALAKRAGDWLLNNGWQETKPLGYLDEERGLSFRAWGDGIEVRERDDERRPPSLGLIYPVKGFAHALNTLAALHILPARFAPLTRDALRDQAEVYTRTGNILMNEAGKRHVSAARKPASGEEYAATAWGFFEAARSADRMSLQRVPA